MKPLERCHVPLNQGPVVLREVSDRSLVSPNHFSTSEERSAIAAGLAQFGIGDRRRTCQQRIQQSGFTRTVAPHQCDLFSSGYTRSEAPDDLGLAVRFCNSFKLKNVFSRRTLLLELQERTLDVRLGKFRHLQAFDFLATRLNLAGARAR